MAGPKGMNTFCQI